MTQAKKILVQHLPLSNSRTITNVSRTWNLMPLLQVYIIHNPTLAVSWYRVRFDRMMVSSMINAVEVLTIPIAITDASGILFIRRFYQTSSFENGRLWTKCESLVWGVYLMSWEIVFFFQWHGSRPQYKYSYRKRSKENSGDDIYSSIMYCNEFLTRFSFQ